MNRTVIGLGEGERKIGEAASLSSNSNYQNTIWGFNRFLGMKQTNPALKKELRSVYPKQVKCENQSIGFELKYHGTTQVFTPEQLCGTFLLYLKKIYNKEGVTCKDIVVSVPPYFTGAERQALLDAIKIAELNCVKLMNETTAIGLSYGLFRRGEFTNVARNVAFVDLGYSKLTVSIISFKDYQYQILAQNWDPNLGARDMDAMLIDLLSADFEAKYKKRLKDNPKALVRLNEAIEKSRKILSANSEIPISVESIMDDRDINYNLKRDDFEKLINPFIERIISLCRSVLEEANLKTDAIHSVEMVGEASRIPIIMRKSSEFFNAPTSRTMNSADCIARGCAIQCAMMSPGFKVAEYGSVEYNPFPIDAIYSLPKKPDGTIPKTIRTLFPKGCNFPLVKSLSFENRRDALDLQLKYGKLDCLHLGGPDLLGNFKIDPGDRKEKHFLLSVKINLDHNMICSVSAAEVVEETIQDGKNSEMSSKGSRKSQEEDTSDTDKSSGSKKKMVRRKTPVDFLYEIHGLSSKRIDDFIERERKMALEDSSIISTQECKNELESFIYQLRAKLSAEYREYTTEKTSRYLLDTINKAEEWLFKEGQNQPKAAYETRLQALHKYADPIIKRFKDYADIEDQTILLRNHLQKLTEQIPEIVFFRLKSI